MKLGNYRLERILGQGRMGVVYLARDEALLRPTALKILAWAFPEPTGYDPEAWFLAEARNVARVNHPSVIQVYSVAKHGAYCYIAMEYVDGVAADRIVSRGGPFEPVKATEIVLQIAGALQAAHACDVVHRDIKPANILIKADGTAKLGDFGMALNRNTGRTSGSHDRVGTPQFTAPEIWRLEPATPATDLYALGATYYFLLTGQPPFDTKDLQTMMTAHLSSDPPDPRDRVPSITPDSAAIVQRCMSKAPCERFESAQALAWELRGLLRTLMATTQVARKPMSTPPALRNSNRPPNPPVAWTTFLGLARSPLEEFTDATRLRRFEPFRSVAEHLLDHVHSSPGVTLMLTGQPGSGRTSLVRSLFAGPEWEHRVAWLDAAESGAGRSLSQRACRAFGTVSNTYVGGAGDIEGLLEHLDLNHPPKDGPAVLILDNATSTQPFAVELSRLAKAAWATRYLSILVIGPHGLPELMARSWTPPAQDALHSVSLPPLTPRQMLEYLRAMIDGARSERAPFSVITPDAALLVAHRSHGNLAQAHRVATNMLQLAALGRTRIVSSWEAWAAADAAAANGSLLRDGATPERPARWPPADVLRVLNANRSEVGIPHRPSHEC